MSTLSYSAEVANTTLPLSKWEPSYVKSPDGRGTIELLTSCLLTYIACIWTAVHPNILPYRSERSYLCYKIAWAVCSMTMPEFVIATAIIQRRESRRILKEWKVHFGATDSEDLNNSTRPTIIDEENIPPKPKNGADWLGKSGAFLVISGGLFIKQPVNVERSATGRSADSDATTVNSNSVITSLTAEGFLMLLKANVFDKLIEDGKLTQDNFHWRVFEDKGKADNLAKSLVCLQILWMFVQCLGRLLQGLPITLLEIHIVIQVCFTIIIYYFWWDKTIDVGLPIVLPIEINAPEMVGINYDFGTKNENFGAVGEHPAFHSEYDNADKPTFGQLFFRTLWDIVFTVTVDHKRVEIIAAALTIVNAVLHGLAWNMLFPTEVERQLYHAACISIAVAALIVLILAYNNNIEWDIANAAYKLSEKGEPSRFFKIFMTFLRHSAENREHHKGLMKPEWIGVVGRWIILFAIAFFVLFYFVAMTIISLEPWLSVRKLEKGSYDTVEWAEMLPHL